MAALGQSAAVVAGGDPGMEVGGVIGEDAGTDDIAVISRAAGRWAKRRTPEPRDDPSDLGAARCDTLATVQGQSGLAYERINHGAHWAAPPPPAPSRSRTDKKDCDRKPSRESK